MQNLRQMAEIICAANRAAGLGDGAVMVSYAGGDDITAPSGEGAALAEAMELAHKAGRNFHDLCSVYQDSTWEGERRRCIVPIYLDVGGDTIPTEESDDASYRLDVEGEGAEPIPLADRIEAATAAIRELGKKVDAIAEHLRSIGFFVEIKHAKETLADGSIDHMFSLEGAIILTEAVSGNADRDSDSQIVRNLLHLSDVPSADIGELDERFVHESSLPVFSNIDLGTETPQEFVRRVAVSPERLHALVNMWDLVGHSMLLFSKSPLLARNQNRRVPFLVPGLVPVGCITLLAGKTMSGKSTLVHELATAVAATASGHQDWSWLGQLIDPEQARGIAVFLAGEDTEDSIAERATILDPDGEATNIACWPTDSRELPHILEEIKALPEVSLIAIDPLAKYIGGDENESKVADRFFRQLEDIAVEKQCAVVVVHHLAKGARPVNISGPGGVIDWIRGSGTIVDRPRVIIGMYRQGDITIVGTQHNMPTSCGMISDPMKFSRNPDTLRHTLAGSGKSKARKIASSEDPAPLQVEEELACQIIAGVRRLGEEGKPITKTGKHELHGHKTPELDGLSRAKIRAGTDALVAAARLVVSDGRLSVAEGEI